MNDFRFRQLENEREVFSDIDDQFYESDLSAEDKPDLDDTEMQELTKNQLFTLKRRRVEERLEMRRVFNEDSDRAVEVD